MLTRPLVSRPAAWGHTVTIGIVSKTFPEGHLVAVSDRMFSFANIVPATDDAAKIYMIGERWLVVFAASDISPVLPMIRRMREALATPTTNGKIPSVATVKDAVSEVYRSFAEAKALSMVLSRFGFTSLKDFRENGLAQLGEAIFERKCRELDERQDVDLGVQLLVCGFDNQGSHIFEVSHVGEVVDHDMLGYAAVGSGCWMAMGAFNARPFKDRSLETTIYRVLDAKFCAETADGVGKETTAFVFAKPERFGLITSDRIEVIRSEWERVRNESPPQRAMDEIDKISVVRQIRKEG
jgi:20S proteasome alpha/beta subunit